MISIPITVFGVLCVAVGAGLICAIALLVITIGGFIRV